MRLHCTFFIWLGCFTGQVVPGLDETFASMKKGEICIATVPSEYGYEGEEKQCDLAVVPANSTLTYEVEMVSFVKVLYISFSDGCCRISTRGAENYEF